MAQDTLLGFPAHTLPYRRREFTTLLTASIYYYSGFPLGKQVPYLPLPHRIGYAPKGAFNKEGITKLWKNPK